VYVFFVYMSTYLHTFLDIPLSTALPASIAGCLVLFVVAPVFGALSDRVGRKPVLIAGALAHVALVVPIFLLIQQGTTWAIVVGYLSLAVTYACYAGPFTAAVAEQFPASVRAASLGIGYQLPVCIRRPISADPDLLDRYDGQQFGAGVLCDCRCRNLDAGCPDAASDLAIRRTR
jgi:MFS transporter, MHS family, proline/betaine transporter